MANTAILVENLSGTFFNQNVAVSAGYTGELFSIAGVTDTSTTVGTAGVTANAVGYFAGDLAGNVVHTPNATKLYLTNVVALSNLVVGTLLKQDFANVQTGSVTTDGSSTITGSNTTFLTSVAANTHLRIGNTSIGYDVVVRSVESNTSLTVYGTANAVAANTYGVYAVGRVTTLYPRTQTSYGVISTAVLSSIGSGYKVPPVLTVDSVDARVQQLFYYNANTDSIISTDGRVSSLYASANLSVVRGAGQITRVKMKNTGVQIGRAHV